MIFKKLELYIKDIIYGRRKGLFPTILLWLLLPISWTYQFTMRVRNWLYDHGWTRRYIPPVPLVISIGNIVAGGTGKTPVTILLAKAFYGRYILAILSRGYRSKVEKLDTPVVLCDGHGPLFPASYCGDEPSIYANCFPKAFVIVGSNRKKAARIASKEGAQVILLDDAMQHRKIARDFDVVVVDVKDPFGQGHFLPRGFLREDVRSLSRADLIILNHIVDQQQFMDVKKRLQTYTHAPVVGTIAKVSAIRELNGNEIETLQGQKVAIFCAIAHPEYFKLTIEKMGAEIVEKLFLADHDSVRNQDLEKFAHRAQKQGATYLVCTEKDRVKLKDDLKLVIPIVWVQIELSIMEGQSDWEAFLSRAEAKIY
jgi:tetraacyldisaccharide 4'-kinase